ncbi:MAG: nucleotidyltransferase family protein [Candidatus Omnitrophica bacterium]|nr:nucleotidyltransferase family protein [Candidatus Omnitrophota bacterium]
MISCILLTAGESQRFGSPKALADIHGKKALEVVQLKLIESIVDEIIIVTGAHESLIKPYVLNHSKVRLVHNKDYKFGQTSSFQTGINSVDPNSKGFMLLPIDCPFVLPQTLEALIHYFNEHHPTILIPAYRDKRGHPPIFHNTLKNEILNLDKNKGLNNLISTHQAEVLHLNDSGIIQTFNTREDLEAILRLT